MKVNHRHYILIFFAIGSVLLAGFGYWFIYSTVMAQAENYSKATQEIQSEEGRTDHEKDLAKIYTDTKALRSQLPHYIISEDKVVEFIESVESAGSISGAEVALSAISTEESHLKGSVQVKGSWQAVMRALTFIENLPYSISIDRMRLGAADKKWELSFDIRALTSP